MIIALKMDDGEKKTSSSFEHAVQIILPDIGTVNLQCSETNGRNHER